MTEFRYRAGGRIKDWRTAAGMTQVQLARAVDPDMDSSQVSRWELGKSFPAYDSICRLAAALKISEEELLAGSPQSAPGIVMTPADTTGSVV